MATAAVSPARAHVVIKTHAVTAACPQVLSHWLKDLAATVTAVLRTARANVVQARTEPHAAFQKQRPSANQRRKRSEE